MGCWIKNIISSEELQPDEIKTLVPDAMMRRRMSRILKTAVPSAVKCAGDDLKSVDAVITATGWGCLADSEKFLRTLIEQNEELLPPTAFIQSTFNTVGGQLALIGSKHCYNMTYVNRGHSFEDALLDSMTRLEDGTSHTVLLGSFDEATPTQEKIMSRMGAFKTDPNGEGAVFMILTNEPQGALAEVTGLEFPQTPLSEEQCCEKWPDCQVLYKPVSSIYPTASSKCIFDAVRGMKGNILIYNELLGCGPAVVTLCV